MPKISPFIVKTGIKLNKGFRLAILWYTWHSPPPVRGGQGPPHTPELKFLMWPSSGPDQYKFILWYKLSFLWKFQQDWPTLRGGLDWSGILWYSRHLHSLDLYFGLDMHFSRNTLLKSIQVATPVGHNMVYNLKSALTEKISACPDIATWGCIFAFLDPILHRWHHWYNRCNPETCAVRFSMCQVIFGPSFLVTEQYLVLVWADLHLFYTIFTAIFALNIFCSDM